MQKNLRMKNYIQMKRQLKKLAILKISARAPAALRKAAQSPHAQIRTAAIAALGDQIQNLGDEDARQLLTNALRDPDEDVRAEATTLMGKLNESEWATPLLLPNLQDEAALVRKNAALSLMKLEDPSVISQLQQCIETESEPSVAVVLNSL